MRHKKSYLTGICIFFSFVANAEIGDQLLNSLPSQANTLYQKVVIDHRFNELVSACKPKLIESKINKNQVNRVTFNLTCNSGKSLIFSGKLEGKTRCLVVKDSLKRKSKLNSNNTEIKWVELSEIKAPPLIDIPSNYYEISRNLDKEQPIYLKILEVAPVIGRGREISAISSTSSIQIKISVIAMEDGALGDFIKVKNISSGSYFYAKVKDASTVVI